MRISLKYSNFTSVNNNKTKQLNQERDKEMRYRIQITENGKSWFLPQTYTYMQAMWEVEMQEELNSLNAIMGEAPAVFDIVEIN